jgi:hypothetical protein
VTESGQPGANPARARPGIDLLPWLLAAIVLALVGEAGLAWKR